MYLLAAQSRREIHGFMDPVFFPLTTYQFDPHYPLIISHIIHSTIKSPTEHRSLSKSQQSFPPPPKNIVTPPTLSLPPMTRALFPLTHHLSPLSLFHRQPAENNLSMPTPAKQIPPRSHRKLCTGSKDVDCCG